jgi:hypothetical protein
VVVSAKAGKPAATLELSGGSVAAGAGVSWGHGSLTYRGKRYPIDAEGLNVGDVGVTRMSASGKVYKLKKLQDFDGTYTAVAAEGTAGGGVGVLAMENQHGVRVNLVSTTQGANLALGVDGVKLKLKR